MKAGDGACRMIAGGLRSIDHGAQGWASSGIGHLYCGWGCTASAGGLCQVLGLGELWFSHPALT